MPAPTTIRGPATLAPATIAAGAARSRRRSNHRLIPATRIIRAPGFSSITTAGNAGMGAIYRVARRPIVLAIVATLTRGTIENESLDIPEMWLR
jgi:hypothetical protein